MERDVVEKMEKRRAAREEARRQERARLDADAKSSAAGSKAEQERCVWRESARKRASEQGRLGAEANSVEGREREHATEQERTFDMSFVFVWCQF